MFNDVDKNKNSLELKEMYGLSTLSNNIIPKKKHNSKISKNTYENIIPKTL